MKYVLILLLCIVSSLALCTTRTVAVDGSQQYTSIQTAINASASGDTVLVYPGTYYENVNIQTSNISLLSLEAITGNADYIDSTIIDGYNTVRCLRVNQNIQNVVIRGLTLTNGFSTGGAGGIALALNTTVILRNLKIYNNTASMGGGINIGAATVILSGVEVFDNYALNFGGGIYAASGSGYLNNITFDPVNRCSIYNNRAGSAQDIYIQNATCNLSVFLDIFSISVPTTYYAIYRSEGLTEYQMSMDILNAHHLETDSDLYVSPDGDDTNNGLSPATALRTIHEGIYRISADSLNQKTVHIMPGTYSRTANNQVFPIALKSWVLVKGSGIDSTHVIGELNPLISIGMNPQNDVFMSNFQNTVSLSKMSISTQNSSNDTVLYGTSFGSVNLSDIYISHVNPDNLSVIWLYLSSEYDSVWDNVIIENIVTPDMGLVDIGGSMSGTISNCKFRNATSTYTSTSVWAYPLVSFCGDRYLTFENCEFSDLTMSDNDTRAIQIGGVQFPQQHNNFSFKNCLFSNNSSQGGIIVVGSSNHPNVSFNNCTFASNEGSTYSLSINGNVNIDNTIFDNDTPYQIKVNPMTGVGETSTLTVDYSCVKDGIAGVQQAIGNTINYMPTNIDSNPLFAGGDDIHDPLYYILSELSPCIDSGTPDITGLDLPPYDLAGNWRVWNGRIDMGCYEYGSEPWVSNDDPEIPEPLQVTLHQNYPNPFNPSTTISFYIPASTHCRLDIYNVRGQRISTLLNDNRMAGTHSVVWTGADDFGANVTSGIYFYRLSTPATTKTAKMILMK